MLERESPLKSRKTKKRQKRLTHQEMEQRVLMEIRDTRMLVARANSKLHLLKSIRKLSFAPITLNRSLLCSQTSTSHYRQTRMLVLSEVAKTKKEMARQRTSVRRRLNLSAQLFS